MDKLKTLAKLIRELNLVGGRIARVIGRPASIGHTGEFIASIIFGIRLEESASAKGIDGRFIGGELDGKSVNIKWYGKLENVLDITPESLPDYYLVMTGPKDASMTSKGGMRPWLIQSVYLFDAAKLLSQLRQRGVKIGVATSVAGKYWIDAEIYPRQQNQNLVLNDEQRHLLALFREDDSA